MNIQKVETQIKTLKSEVKNEKKEGVDPLAARKTKKRLKRAQRKKNCMLRRAALIASKQKKEEAAS